MNWRRSSGRRILDRDGAPYLDGDQGWSFMLGWQLLRLGCKPAGIAVSAEIDRFAYPTAYVGKTQIDQEGVQECSSDEWLLVEIWDES